jgi:hypothetical protein
MTLRFHPPPVEIRGADHVGPLSLLVSLLLAATILAAVCSCRPERPPIPGVGPVLAELDRAERGIVTHEIVVRDWRLAQ